MLAAFGSLALWAGILAGAASGQGSLPAGFEGYAFRHRQAADVAPQLRNLLQGVPGQSNVLVDTEANRLLVQGPAEVQQLATQFVQAMDQASGSVPQGPAVDAPEVKGYRVPAGDPKAVAARLQADFARTSGVRIAVDERTQQLIVVAPAATQAQIAERLNQITTRSAAGSTAQPSATARLRRRRRTPAEVPAYQLRNVTWRELEDSLRQTWGSQLRILASGSGEVATVELLTPAAPQPVLEIDRRLDRVRFVGQPSARAWFQAVQALDSDGSRSGEQTQLVPVRNADPAKVQSAVSLIRAAGLEKQGDMSTAAMPVGSAKDRPRWGGQLISLLFQDQTAGAPAAPAAEAPAAPSAGCSGSGGGRAG